MNNSQSIKIFIPGIKQFETGKTVIGLVWLIGTLTGYLSGILPGLIIHGIYLYMYCRQEIMASIQNYDTNQENFTKFQTKIENLQQDENVREAIKQAEKLKDIAKEKISGYQNSADIHKLEKAANHIEKEQFTEAITILEKIKPDSEVYQKAQEKISEYRKAFDVKLLQDASNKASNGNYSEALKSLRLIPEKAELYKQAQSKIAECEEEIRKEGLERENFLRNLESDKEAVVFHQEASYRGGIKGYPSSADKRGFAYVLKNSLVFYDDNITWKVLYERVIKAELDFFQLRGTRAVLAGGDTGRMLQEVKNTVAITYLDKTDVERTAKFQIHGALTIPGEAIKAQDFLNYVLDFKGNFLKPNASSSGLSSNYIETLEKLKKLKDEGIISESDFEAKKRSILDNL